MTFKTCARSTPYTAKATGGVEEIDPILARKKADEEEEARRAAARAHGIHVTVETFAAWKQAVCHAPNER